MSKLSDAKIDFIIRNIRANFAFENMYLSDTDNENLLKLLHGEITSDDIARQVAQEYIQRGTYEQ